MRQLSWLCLLFLLWPAVVRADSQNLAPGFSTLPGGTRVALMAPDVELFSISAGGVVEPQAEWTTAALGFVAEGLRRARADKPLDFADVADNADPGIDDLQRLHGAVGQAILMHHFGPLALPTKEKKLDWSLGPAVASIRQASGADYALFVYVRDSYASAERKVAMVAAAMLGVGLPGGIQYGYASLVDLRNGNVVWFNRLLRGHGDLREREPALESVRALLAGFPG